MGRILNYSTFKSSGLNELTHEQIEWLDQCTTKKWELNTKTGLIDVRGFYCSNKGISDFMGISFGDIKISFCCDLNSLTSLAGSPLTVGGNFYCENNSLTSLEGAPDHVGGNFYCDHNSLTSLEGAPDHVKGSFYCSNNSLTSLEGAPDLVKGGFSCHHNSLTSLEGAPGYVGGVFYCSNNSLTSLEGAPDHVGGSFLCGGNPVSESTLGGIFRIMQTGKSYLDALEEYWALMDLDDQILMYKDKKGLSPEEIKKYSTLARYNNMKGLI